MYVPARPLNEEREDHDTPLGRPLGLVPLPLLFLAVLAGIMIFYIVVAEAAKTFFYRHAAA